MIGRAMNPGGVAIGLFMQILYFLAYKTRPLVSNEWYGCCTVGNTACS
jgi:hypothetical protein